MNNVDNQYLDLCEFILNKGKIQDDRTGTGVLSIFGHQMRFNLKEGFPLLTTKKVPYRIVKEELLWFLSGSNNLKDLLEKDVHIWDDDAYRNYKEHIIDSPLSKTEFISRIKNSEAFASIHGDMGPIYGVQMRGIHDEQSDIEYKKDQIAELIEGIKNNPNGRRHLLVNWNPQDIELMALPPCHVLAQFKVYDGELSCQLYQRSADVFLGLPFNIASYATLTHMIAQVCGLEVGELIVTLGDAHVYLNHVDQVREQLSRRNEAYDLPELHLNSEITDIDDFDSEDIHVFRYNSHPTIKAPLSVGLKED